MKEKRIKYIYENNKKIIDIIKDELIIKGFIDFELNQLWDDSTPIGITSDELEYYFKSNDCYVEVCKNNVYIELN